MFFFDTSCTNFANEVRIILGAFLHASPYIQLISQPLPTFCCSNTHLCIFLFSTLDSSHLIG